MQNKPYEPNQSNEDLPEKNAFHPEDNDEEKNQTGNISYIPYENGTYNCYGSFSQSNTRTQSVSLKKWTLVMLLAVSLISSLAGFMAARFTYYINGGHNPIESIQSSSELQDTVNVSVAPTRPKVETEQGPADNKSPMTVADVCDAVMDANVEIVTETAAYNQIYGYYVTEGAGSGVIISKDGYIITNHHVVENASSITVTLSNGNSYKASLVGSDSVTDIAVLSISASEELHPAVLGSSGSVRQGEEVVIIGNPLGSLGSSVTNGIISAIDRHIIVNGNEMVLMQTNAPINPGNSGGGMYNMYGELIGIVNAKSSGTDIEGIGFAIPIDSAFDITSQIIEFGYVRGRVDHGLTVIVVDDIWDMTRYNVSKTGIYIYKSEYYEELKSGDRLVSINGTEIKSTTDITKALQGCNAGDKVTITVERKNSSHSYEVVLREYVPQDNQQ